MRTRTALHIPGRPPTTKRASTENWCRWPESNRLAWVSLRPHTTDLQRHIKRQTIANLPPARASPLASPPDLYGGCGGVVAISAGQRCAQRRWLTAHKKSTQPFLPGAGGVITGYTVPALFLPATSQRRCASKRIAAPFATYAVRRRSYRITMNGNRTRVCPLNGGRTDPCATTAHAPQYSPDDELPIPTARDHTLKKGDVIGSSQQSLNDITHYTTSHATLSTTTRNIFCNTSHGAPGAGISTPGYTRTPEIKSSPARSWRV